MRKFQCLLFVLKQSYFLLHNLHDCTFNDSFQFFWVFLIISWKGALLFNGRSFLIEGGHPWGHQLSGGRGIQKNHGMGRCPPTLGNPAFTITQSRHLLRKNKIMANMCPEIPSESLLLSEFFPNSSYCYQKIHSKQHLVLPNNSNQYLLLLAK